MTLALCKTNEKRLRRMKFAPSLCATRVVTHAALVIAVSVHVTVVMEFRVA